MAGGRKNGRKAAAAEGVAGVVAVNAREVGMEARMEVEVGPQIQGDDGATGGSRPCEGDHDDVRGDVHGGVHDDVHAYAGACEPPRRHSSQPSGHLHHPVG